MSLLARHLEANGIPTLCLASARDIIEAGNPPRAVFVDYPLGHTSGRPHDAVDQLSIIRAAMASFESIERPGQLDVLPNRWSHRDDWRTGAMNPDAGDTRAPRDKTPQYQTDADRRAAEGG
ncbi:MAG: hypothetical protein AAF493_15825 [Pseudomonadota bacterium]